MSEFVKATRYDGTPIYFRKDRVVCVERKIGLIPQCDYELSVVWTMDCERVAVKGTPEEIMALMEKE